MLQKFPYDRDFQVGILALMMQRLDFFLMAFELFQPDFFEDKILIWYFQTIKDYYNQYKELPTILVLENELKKSAGSGRIRVSEFGDYASVCKKLKQPVDEQFYVIDEVVRFCRRQVGRRIFLDSAPKMDTADDGIWDEIIEKVQGISNIGANFDIGIKYFEDSERRVMQRLNGIERKILPTGIDELDSYIGGGLKEGQLGIWMGSTGYGKSICLPHCGKRAVVGGYRVLHYTLELDAEDVAERYDANWTRTPVHELKDRSFFVIDKLKQLGTKYGGRLIIKHYPSGTATVSALKTHIRQLSTMKWYPDLIIVDYGDLLKPTSHYNEEWADLGRIFTDLRGMAGEMHIPIWTATQVNRAGTNLEVVDVEHIGDSLRKAQIADLVIALCATREERLNNDMRLFLAKNRNGPSKLIVNIKTAFDRMCFYDPMFRIQKSAAPPSMPVPVKRRKAQQLVT